MKVVLTHTYENNHETIGQWVVSDEEKVLFMCATLELPFKGNQRRISRIYKGIFDCIKVGPTRNIPYDHIWIKDVDGRSGIKVHIVNYVRQLRGCVGVGYRHKDIDGDDQLDVTMSKKTLSKLMAILPEQFKLEIR